MVPQLIFQGRLQAKAHLLHQLCDPPDRSLQLPTCCQTTKFSTLLLPLMLLYGTNLDCIMENNFPYVTSRTYKLRLQVCSFKPVKRTSRSKDEGCGAWEHHSDAVRSQHTCSKHDRWIAIVCTADDCSNDNAAVGQLVFISFILNRHGVILFLSCNLKPFDTRLHDKNIC